MSKSLFAGLAAVCGLMIVASPVVAQCPLQQAHAAQAQVVHFQSRLSQPQVHIVYEVAVPQFVSTTVVNEQKDIVDTAVGAGSFNTLVAAVKAAGLVDALKGDGPLTVFAPTDEAFKKLPKGTVESLLKPENKDKLVAILTYHVVAGKVMAADVVKLDSAKSLQGQAIPIKVADGKVTAGGANVVKTDIECSNGVIHVIDSVILPPEKKEDTGPKNILETATAAGSFKTLAAAIGAAGLADALNGDGPFTVFAPTDEAFKKLPEGTVETLLKPENKEKLAAILKYHVLPSRTMAVDVMKLDAAQTLQGSLFSITKDGGVVKIDNAKVVKTDIVCSNGVIHVIDSVILPKE